MHITSHILIVLLKTCLNINTKHVAPSDIRSLHKNIGLVLVMKCDGRELGLNIKFYVKFEIKYSGIYPR